MNKVVTINLNGNAYQLEEAGFEALRTYLDHAARQLEGNPDKEEIIADIEQAIGDKCRGLLGPHRSVILTKDIESIIAEMGPVDDGSPKPASGATAADRAAGSPPPPPAPGDPASVRRIYRLYDGAMLSGVCNGIAAYFAIDPTIVRIVFVLLAFITFGGMALAYFILVLLLPEARTATEKAAAHGTPSTAQDFIRRAREGYYEAARTFHDKQAHREWKRKFRHEMRAWRRNFSHEMNAQAHHWQSNWQQGWTQHPGAHRGFWFTLSLLSLVRGLLAVVWVFALLSLLTTGAVFGVALPAGMPLWVGALLLCLIYGIIVSPLRATRHLLYRHGWGGGPYVPAFFGLWDTLLWLGFVAFLIWLADRYVPHAHEALLNVPPTLHHVAESFQQWWTRQ